MFTTASVHDNNLAFCSRNFSVNVSHGLKQLKWQRLGHFPLLYSGLSSVRATTLKEFPHALLAQLECRVRFSLGVSGATIPSVFKGHETLQIFLFLSLK